MQNIENNYFFLLSFKSMYIIFSTNICSMIPDRSSVFYETRYNLFSYCFCMNKFSMNYNIFFSFYPNFKKSFVLLIRTLYITDIHKNKNELPK